MQKHTWKFILFFLISQFFSSLWNLVAFQSITTFCLLFKFDNEAKSYLGGWCSDVLLRLSTSYLFILSILFGGQTLNTLVDGPVMYFYIFLNPIFSLYLYFWGSDPKYLGGWSGDVLLRLLQPFFFILSIPLGVRP